MNDDLISRQAAIDAVNNLTYPSSLVDVKRILVDLPSVQPERKNRKWILLSEKVPEMDERVIVINNGYEYHIWDCMSNRGDDYCWEDEEGLYHNKYEVVAWLPLPEVIL